jgi:putative transposase
VSVQRTYKYRLYPTDAQARALDGLLEQGRQLYNAALEQRRRVYAETGQGPGYEDQWAHFRDERHAHPETLGQLNATSVQQMLRRLDKSYAAFFRRVQAGETPGFPRFKGANRFHSLEYRYGDGCKLRPNDETGRVRFYVQNVGEIKLHFHRDVPVEAQVKHVVLKRSLGRWYVCLMWKAPKLPEPPAHPGSAVGIDVGLTSLLALSDGRLVDNPHWLRETLAELRVAQRQVARRHKGSQGWRDACRQVAALHQRIANARRDFYHKLSRRVTTTYSLIALEDLPLDFMLHNPYLARSAHDAALGEFRDLLAYKAEEAGARVVAVPPQDTSQVCSGCGRRVPKDLSVRVHVCPHADCGLILNRDVNAARNVLQRALSPPGRGGQAST